MNQKDLLEAVLRYAAKSMRPPLNKDGSVVLCQQYSHDDLGLYLNGRIVGREKEAFEHHTSHCDICLYGLAQLREEMENKKLTDAALEYMKNYKPRPSFANVLQVAAIWKGKLAWFTEILGAATLPPGVVMATRSGGQAIKANGKKVEKPRKILKQLDDFGISVEVNIGTTDSGNTLSLEFSFFDMTSQKFIERLSVQLIGYESRQEITDEDGRASFMLSQSGVYDVFVTRDQGEALLHFNLDLSDKEQSQSG